MSGEPAGFAAQITNASDDDAPVAGVEVTFELTGPGGSQSASATTGPDGVATADPLVDLAPATTSCARPPTGSASTPPAPRPRATGC